MSETEFGRPIRQVGNAGGVAADRTSGTVADLAAKASEAISHAGAAVRDATNDAARKTATVASDLGRDAYQRGDRVRRDVASQIEAQPLTSILIAAVAGLCVGMLLARR